MIKKFICGIICAGSALSSQAAQEGFDWTLTGFTPRYSTERDPYGTSGPFDPNEVVQGRFVVDDVNQDGVFSAAELISFTVGGNSFVPCPPHLDTCLVDNFSYAKGSTLAFTVHSSSGSASAGSSWHSDWQYHSYSPSPSNYGHFSWSFSSDSSGYGSYASLITPETKFAISPVPEAQTWLMLSAGMLLLGVAKRRRTRKA